MDQAAQYFGGTVMKTYYSHSPRFADVIEIEMVALGNDEPSVFDEAEHLAVFKNLFGGTMLRGSVHTDGRLHSFWLKNEQLSLISLLGGLPSYPVKMGDRYFLRNLLLLCMDQNFLTQEAKQPHRVGSRRHGGIMTNLLDVESDVE